MKSLKIAMLVAVWLLLTTWSGSARADNSRASAERLLQLMHQDQFVLQIIDYLKEQQGQQLQKMELSQAQTALAATYFEKIYNLIQSEMSWEKIKEDYIDLYLTVYSHEEIEGLIAFYEAPLGRKVIEKMPELMEQAMLINQDHMLRLIPEIQKIHQDLAEELGKPSPSHSE